MEEKWQREGLGNKTERGGSREESEERGGKVAKVRLGLCKPYFSPCLSHERLTVRVR
jgi:hypothetical protein